MNFCFFIIHKHKITSDVPESLKLCVCVCHFQIVFYEGRCFTGQRLEVYGDCDNFQDRGFMNRVNSIRVESGAWICYDHPDFKGQQYILERGEYPEFQRWNAHNDHMGSCKPIRMVRNKPICVTV